MARGCLPPRAGPAIAWHHRLSTSVTPPARSGGEPAWARERLGAAANFAAAPCPAGQSAWLEQKIGRREGVEAREAQLKLYGAGIGVGVGLDEGLTAQLHDVELAGSGEGRRADEGEGLIAGSPSVGVDRRQVDDVTDGCPIALEVGDEIVIADAHARFVEGVEQEGVIAQPAGQIAIAGTA